MSSTLVKATIALTGLTTVGGGATFIYLNSANTKWTNQKEHKTTDTPREIIKTEPEASTVISSLFTKEKIALLNGAAGDANAWRGKWTTFKGKYTTLKEQEAWKFTKWTESEPTEEEGIRLLKEKCNTNSVKKVVNEKSQLFLDVKEFCTKTTAEQPENK